MSLTVRFRRFLHHFLITARQRCAVPGRAFRQADQDRRVRGVQRADRAPDGAGAVRRLAGLERRDRSVSARVHDGRRRPVHVLFDRRRHQGRDRHRHVSGQSRPRPLRRTVVTSVVGR